MDPLPEDHQFTHSELSYEAEPNFQPAIKVSVFFRKKDGISHEDFFKHWQTVHADDCSRFMALPMTYMIGYENLVVGDAAQAIGGKSGLSTKTTQ